MADVLPRHVLHVGNILNNGYLHAKYLRRHGVGAEVLNVDDVHCQAQPEWAEVHLSDPVAEWGQDWNTLDLGGFYRPEWYHGVANSALPALARHLDGLPCPPGGVARAPQLTALPPLTALHYSVRRTIARAMGAAGFEATVERIRNHVRLVRLERAGLSRRDVDRLVANLCAEFRHFFPDATRPLSRDDIHEFLPGATARSSVLARFQLIQAYSLDPIHALLGAPGQPFVCYEHGTMRDFPFEDSARGRLYSLALKKAEKVFITNADCIEAARRLKLDNWVFVPHLIDDERFTPGETALRASLLKEANADRLILCPARHHWKNAPPGLENSFFKGNDKLIRGLAKFMKERPQHRVAAVFFSFGQEVELSRQLIAEMGISDQVLWRPIQSKLAMRDYYRAADLVCDQFHGEIRAFGAVVGEAMACGKPMLSNLNRELNAQAFPVLPPIVHATAADAIHQALLELFDTPEALPRLGAESLAWYREHHSSRLVMERMIGVYTEIAHRFGWDWSFN